MSQNRCPSVAAGCRENAVVRMALSFAVGAPGGAGATRPRRGASCRGTCGTAACTSSRGCGLPSLIAAVESKGSRPTVTAGCSGGARLLGKWSPW